MPSRACFLFIVALASFVCAATRAHGQQMGWDATPGTPGAQGGTGNWLGTNFWYVLPSNSSWIQGAGATFGGTAGTVTVNGAVTADNLVFSVNGYVVSGSSTLTLSGADTVQVTNSGQTETISAPIGGTGGFTKFGAGTLTLSGTAANTYSGTATVNEGTLNLSKSAGVNAITGNLTIGDGSGAASSAVVMQGADNQIANSANVTIKSDGSWNLASGNRSETVGALTINSGNLTSGTGSLVVSSLTMNGGSVSASGSGGQIYSGILYIANSGTATLGAALGSQITTNANAFIGHSAGSTGTATLAPLGFWDVSGDVYVGNSGNGTLNVDQGSVVTDTNAYVGYAAGSTGTAGVGSVYTNGSTVHSTWQNNGTLYVGRDGNGSLTVADGGEVTNTTGYVGYSASSTSTVTVSGVHGFDISTWSSSGPLYVGYSGTGSLDIKEGAHVSSAGLQIGYNTGSTGTVTIAGTVSQLDAGPINVGTNGSGSLILNSAGTALSGGVYGSSVTLGSAGELRGTGYVRTSVVNGGIVAPGNSAGTLNIANGRDYTQTASGTLAIELTSTASFDQLIVSGTATLTGTLSVSLLGGFVPAAGQTYGILTASSVTGTFGTLTFPTLSNVGFDVVYNSPSVLLKTYVLGDFDRNGFVDAAD